MFKWLANEKLNTAADTLGKFAAFAALFVAGYWTYRTFHISVEPGLEFRGTVDADVKWARSGDDSTCYGTLIASVSNEGVTAFDVLNVAIRGWMFDVDEHIPKEKESSKDRGPDVFRAPVDAPTPIDYLILQDRKSFVTAEYKSGDAGSTLVGHYVQGVKARQSWTWLFRRADGKNVAFRMQLQTTKDGPTQTAWTSDEVCGEPPARENQPTKK